MLIVIRTWYINNDPNMPLVSEGDSNILRVPNSDEGLLFTTYAEDGTPLPSNSMRVLKIFGTITKNLLPFVGLAFVYDLVTKAYYAYNPRLPGGYTSITPRCKNV